MSISCFVKIKLDTVDVGSGPFNASPQVYQLGHCRACYESSTHKMMEILFVQIGVRGS